MRLTSFSMFFFVVAQNAMGSYFNDGTFSLPIGAPPPTFHKALSDKLTSDHIYITDKDICGEALQRRTSTLRPGELLAEDTQYRHEAQWVRWALAVNLAHASPTSLDLGFFHPLIHLAVLSSASAKDETGAFRLRHLGVQGRVLLDFQGPEFSKYLSQNTSLTSLCLYGDFSRDMGAHLRSFPYLTHLDLFVCPYARENTDHLIDILNKKNEDGSFRLRHLCAPAEFLESFTQSEKGATMGSQDTPFESLHLYGILNGQRCAALSRFPHLIQLDLSRAVFRSEATPTLLTYIENSPSLISFKALAPSKEEVILKAMGAQGPLTPEDRQKCSEKLLTIEKNYILKSRMLLSLLHTSMQETSA